MDDKQFSEKLTEMVLEEKPDKETLQDLLVTYNEQEKSRRKEEIEQLRQQWLSRVASVVIVIVSTAAALLISVAIFSWLNPEEEETSDTDLRPQLLDLTYQRLSEQLSKDELDLEEFQAVSGLLETLEESSEFDWNAFTAITTVAVGVLTLLFSAYQVERRQKRREARQIRTDDRTPSSK